MISTQVRHRRCNPGKLARPKFFRPPPAYFLSIAEEIAHAGPFIPPNEDFVDVIFPNDQARLTALRHHFSQVTPQNSENPPQVFQYGIQYSPNPHGYISDEMRRADYECRTVIITGVKADWPIRAILPLVRGGKILRIVTATSQLGYTANVQFVKWREAHAYVKYLKTHKLSPFGRGVSVELANMPSYPIALETREDINHGFTRCLAILNFSLPIGRFLDSFRAWYVRPEDVFEDVWLDDDSTLYLLFRDIAYASRYYKAVAGQHQGQLFLEKLYFTHDPCSGPLEELREHPCLARGRYESELGALTDMRS
ncbi:hypothetical protein F4779DRAFT_155112 [Xylariaceae sp. FL0662B]|nr:hypothetical protein F4779DRAFT_155112 [Xylariaceae sp. FL0662B]